MAVSFSQIPANLRLPLFHAEVDGSQASYFVQDQRALLIGQRLAAGTAAADVPVLVSSPDQAVTLFGAGSVLARMVALYRRNDDFGAVWCLPVADAGAAAAATGTVVLTGTATAAGALSLYIAGQRVQIAVASGNTAAVVATALAAAIAATPDLPVTATAATGTVTLTAKNKGLLGNDIDLRLNYLGALGGEATPAGLTVTVTAMANGTAAPSLAAGIAALGDEPFDFIACPYTDTASLDALKGFMDDQTGRWAWSRQLYGHVFAARRGTVAELSTFGNARNDPHVTVMGYAGSPSPSWEWAAALTAQAAKSLRIDPARPLQTLPLVGILAPTVSARFTMSERQILLFDGVATFSTGTDGTVRIERAITTYQVNAYGQPDPSFLDVETLFTLATVLRRLRSVITTKYARHKLANDGTTFGAGQAIVTPKIIKAELIAQYSEMETLGLVENLPAFKANLMVERDLTDPNRLNVLYPPDLVNQLRVFAVLAQFRLQYAA
ncbi:phage tail sheath subtilisin-like domain-containing protein [Azospirillum argentinense]